MRSHIQKVLGTVITVGILMIATLGLHVGGNDVLNVGRYSPLVGAFLGGILILVAMAIPIRPDENVERWGRHEKMGWVLIGCGCIAWGIGECFWRYFVAQGQTPFPSLADAGYASFFPLVFLGLIFQQFSVNRAHKLTFLLLDSLIAMGALLSIAWFLLLGPLAQTPDEALLGKIIGLYYPTTDVALLSCTIFLLLREQDHSHMVAARRVSLLLVGLGLSIYAASDFLFNVLQNMNLSPDGTWVDLGWPLGMMVMGVAAYLRRFLPTGNAEHATTKQEKGQGAQFRFGPLQVIPYLLLLPLFFIVMVNVLSSSKIQQDIRPVLMGSTIVVIGLVIIRQIITILDNKRLVQDQIASLEKLEQVYQEIEKRRSELEIGITHLKEIQTRLANGDIRARARNLNGDLWPLASGLNRMADRMMRAEQREKYALSVIKAIDDLNQALEQRKNRTAPFVLPASCLSAPPELHRLLQIMGIKSAGEPSLPQATSLKRNTPDTGGW